MNYRHAFHAGGFADVFKHTVLCRILDYLLRKSTPFRVIDTHAGAGVYDLTSDEADRGGDWHDGIKKLLAASLPKDCADLLKPYFDVVSSLNRSGEVRFYPGSPELARANLRPQDRLLACELEPTAAAILSRHFQSDRRVKTLIADGWKALPAHMPPPERRGLVLIDPPFELESDFRDLADSLAAAHRKWATGIYVLWYPIKGRTMPDTLAKRISRGGIKKVLRAELIVSTLSDPTRLNGSGLMIVNPPWTLERELATLLPCLVRVLGRDKPKFTLDWLVGEKTIAR